MRLLPEAIFICDEAEWVISPDIVVFSTISSVPPFR